MLLVIRVITRLASEELGSVILVVCKYVMKQASLAAELFFAG
jgi:hypothetical protein